MEEEAEESVKLTLKTTVASVIKEMANLRGSYQQTSAENAQVEVIQSKLTISMSTTLSQIAKQDLLIEQWMIKRIVSLVILQQIACHELITYNTWPVEEVMDTLN